MRVPIIETVFALILIAVVGGIISVLVDADRQDEACEKALGYGAISAGNGFCNPPPVPIHCVDDEPGKECGK